MKLVKTTHSEVPSGDLERKAIHGTNAAAKPSMSLGKHRGYNCYLNKWRSKHKLSAVFKTQRFAGHIDKMGLKALFASLCTSDALKNNHMNLDEFHRYCSISLLEK